MPTFSHGIGGDKVNDIINKISSHKAKPTCNKNNMYVGLSINNITGEVETIMPPNSSPDTVSYNLNRSKQVESKEKTKRRLLKKLSERLNQS